jgi:hypothetical protein
MFILFLVLLFTFPGLAFTLLAIGIARKVFSKD